MKYLITPQHQLTTTTPQQHNTTTPPSNIVVHRNTAATYHKCHVFSDWTHKHLGTQYPSTFLDLWVGILSCCTAGWTMLLQYTRSFVDSWSASHIWPIIFMCVTSSSILLHDFLVYRLYNTHSKCLFNSILS